MAIMLKKRIEDYIAKASAFGAVELHIEEKAYAERLGLLKGVQVPIKELSGEHRFEKAYIERGDKETEEFLGEESAEFLKQPISYFRA